MKKYLYLIKKAKIKSWLKFWLMTNKQFTIVLSEILEGTSFNLQNTVKKRFKIFNIFVNSVQNGTPSPNNPVEIQSVADDVNLFDASKIINPNIVVTDNGKTITMPLATSGNGNTDTNAKLNELCPNLQVGDNIYLRFTRNLGNTYNNFIYLVGSGKTIYNTSNTATTITQQDLDSIVYLYANRYQDGETTQCVLTDFRIVKNKNTPYSPYNYGTFTIDFEGQTENYNYTFITKPLRSLPNGVRDSLEADGIHRKIGIQTGTLSQTTTITLSDAKQNGAYMCNIKSAGTLTGKTIELEAGDYEIIYELAEEIIEPYTEEQQEQYNKIKELYTFDGTTNIYSTDVVPPYLQIQYYMKGE